MLIHPTQGMFNQQEERMAEAEMKPMQMVWVLEVWSGCDDHGNLVSLHKTREGAEKTAAKYHTTTEIKQWPVCD